MVVCCLCKRYGWEEALPSVYRDKSGNDYCVFHAEKGQKGVTPAKFAKIVISRIRQRILEAEKDKGDYTCNMKGVVFPWDINISELGLRKCAVGINFSGSVFHGKAEINALTMSKKVSFSHVFFKDKLILNYVTFSRDVSFQGTKFFGELRFSNVQFDGDIDFTFSIFKEDAEFYRTIFNGGIDCRQARFLKEADFFQVQFSRKINFFRCKGGDNSFKMEEISDKSISNIVFTRLEARQFAFRDCRWPKQLGLEKHSEEVGANLLDCEELYRAMKQRACLDHDQGMASKWHYREKLMKLKRRLWKPFIESLTRFVDYEHGFSDAVKQAVKDFALVFITPFRALMSLLFLYFATSGFGERAVRAFFGLTVFVTITIALCANVEMSDNTSQYVSIGYPERFNAALQHLFFITNPKYSPQNPNWRSALILLTRVIVPIQFTLFALAVRNRFRR